MEFLSQKHTFSFWSLADASEKSQLSCHYLLQRIAVVVQRGSTAAVLGTSPVGSDVTDIF